MWYFLRPFPSFFHENQSTGADSAELVEHWIFFADQPRVERDRRFARDEARLDAQHGEMKISLRKGEASGGSRRDCWRGE